ncbi:antirestriction protein [Kushneria indalinina]|uniref:Antirestriction protein n=1 Tax=Kushneria indalinina DSM 14324 TaxID=1122140 RepID=A0A3D9DRL5_9GAMM|nr:antirestriction protein [Kushneria indalinina]REC93301.1 antirestriction protein [Kushneria indalinina DSM 14324]
MSEVESTEPVITATAVPHAHRTNCLPAYFGSKYLQVEVMINQHMRKLCADYEGGIWEFYELSNGGFYMHPKGQEKMHVCVPDNYCDVTMSPDAAGITACLFAINHLTWITRSTKHIDLYHALRDYAMDHEESSLIMRAID